MDNNERIIKIEELKKLKEEVIKEAKENMDNEETTNRERYISCCSGVTGVCEGEGYTIFINNNEIHS